MFYFEQSIFIFNLTSHGIDNNIFFDETQCSHTKA